MTGKDIAHYGILVGGAALIGWLSPNIWLTLELAILWWYIWTDKLSEYFLGRRD